MKVWSNLNFAKLTAQEFFFWQIVLINYMSEKITLKYDWLRAGQFVFNS